MDLADDIDFFLQQKIRYFSELYAVGIKSTASFITIRQRSMFISLFARFIPCIIVFASTYLLPTCAADSFLTLFLLRPIFRTYVCFILTFVGYSYVFQLTVIVRKTYRHLVALQVLVAVIFLIG